ARAAVRKSVLRYRYPRCMSFSLKCEIPIRRIPPTSLSYSWRSRVWSILLSYAEEDPANQRDCWERIVGGVQWHGLQVRRSVASGSQAVLSSATRRRAHGGSAARA